MSEQGKNLRKYIIPSILGNISFFILTIVDGMFVGNCGNPDALGAVSVAMPFVMFVSAISVLFNVGGVAVAAVRFGRGDSEGANQAFMHSLSAISVIFTLLSVVGFVFSNHIAGLLGADERYLQMTSDYIRLFSLFLLPTGLFYCFNTFGRNDGNPTLSTKAAIICTATNIIGDWIMVYPLRDVFGAVGGAAFASGFANLAACLFVSTHYIFKKGQLRVKKFRVNFSLYGKLMLRGFPEMIAQFATPITTFSMNNMLMTNPNVHSVNAFSVIGYASSLFASLMYGLAGGLQPLYGQSYGAKDDKSLKYYFRSGLTIAAAGGIGIFLLTFIIGKPICALFGAEAEAVPLVVSSLPKYCLNYVFAVLSAVIAAYLFSTKRTRFAIPLNVCRSLIFNFSCINFLPLIFGADFVWYTVAIAEFCCLIIAVVLWRVSERKGIVYK